MQALEFFVDLDGVEADYEGEYRRIGGEPNEKGKVKAARLKAHPHFYRTLPLLPDAMHLWNFLKPHHPSILSAQSNYVPASRHDKHEWVAQHLGLSGPKVIVVDYPNEKWKYCTGKHCVLIDDNDKNCAEWEKAGGTAILHRSAADTIQKVKALLNHVNTSHVQEAFETLKTEPSCANLCEAFDELLDRT